MQPDLKSRRGRNSEHQQTYRPPKYAESQMNRPAMEARDAEATTRQGPFIETPPRVNKGRKNTLLDIQKRHSAELRKKASSCYDSNVTEEMAEKVTDGGAPKVTPRRKPARLQSQITNPQVPPRKNKKRRSAQFGKKASSCYDSNVTEEMAEKEPETNAPARPHGKPGDKRLKDLTKIWTAAFCGSEESFDSAASATPDAWLVFSGAGAEEGLFLRRGGDGPKYPITGQYSVRVGEEVCSGRVLSELMEDVHQKLGGEAVPPRKGASLIYSKDLLRYIAKPMEPKWKDSEGSVLGKGEFGEVVKRSLEVGGEKCGYKDVAVKRIRNADPSAVVGGMELAVMQCLKGCAQRSHVLQMEGWYEEPGYLCLVTEYMDGGSLLEFLLNPQRQKIALNSIAYRQCQNRFVGEIACGMCALEERGLLHRDLAARNILLTGDLTAKIGDFCLSRPVGSTYTMGKLPIKWTAPEALDPATKEHPRSDVWSFGVVVWEIYNCGLAPFLDVEDDAVLDLLRRGDRLDAGGSMPGRMRDLLDKCWQWDPEKRPSFAEIAQRMTSSSLGGQHSVPTTPPPPPSH